MCWNYLFVCTIKHGNQLSVNKHTQLVDINVWNRVIEWLLFNANSAIIQLYHGKNKLIFNEMMMSWICIMSADRHFAPFGHISLIPSKPVIALSP
jgi:hypothetical protein